VLKWLSFDAHLDKTLQLQIEHIKNTNGIWLRQRMSDFM